MPQTTDTKNTLDQRRAADAFAKIEQLRVKGKYGNYISYVKSLPATILQNGLGQALATELGAAKGQKEDPHGLLHGHVESWLCDDRDGVFPGETDVLAAIISHDEAQYLHAQSEALAYLNWLKKWIDTVTSTKAGPDYLIDELTLRRAMMFEKLGGTVSYFETTSPFVTGLGRSHPVENGFAWHQSLGAPFLPGSSVKGLVRDWAVMWEGLGAREQLAIFGSDRKENAQERQAGSVVFWDAIPIKPVHLEADVMTPHYTDYYQEQNPPGDWLSPNPIHFLVVSADQTVQFCVSLREGSERDRDQCEQVSGWLTKALQHVGAGAKTAAGYGRFAINTVAQGHVTRTIEARLAAIEEAESQAESLKQMADASAIAQELNKHIFEQD